MMAMTRYRIALPPALPLVVVMVLVALCLTALACGPASPAVVPAATPSATPAGEAGWDNSAPPPTPSLTRMERRYPNLSGYFIRKIQQYEAAADAVDGRMTPDDSEQPAPTPEALHLIITIDAHNHVDMVQRFLEESGASQIECMKFPSDYVVPGECGAVVPVSQLRGLAEQSGVLDIESQRTMTPASELTLPVPQQLSTNAHGVTAWRLAGANDNGVGGAEVESGSLAAFAGGGL